MFMDPSTNNRLKALYVYQQAYKNRIRSCQLLNKQKQSLGEGLSITMDPDFIVRDRAWQR